MSKLPRRSNLLKNAVRKLLPAAYLRRRARMHQQRFRAQAGVPSLASRFITAYGTTVTGGPMAGLTYPAALLKQIDAPVAKLIGAYEPELQDALDTAVHGGHSTFVDIGAAEGYYAVG